MVFLPAYHEVLHTSEPSWKFTFETWSFVFVLDSSLGGPPNESLGLRPRYHAVVLAQSVIYTFWIVLMEMCVVVVRQVCRRRPCRSGLVAYNIRDSVNKFVCC